MIDTDIATVDPPQLAEPFPKRDVLRLRFGISFG
jgi:hypothetical protein